MSATLPSQPAPEEDLIFAQDKKARQYDIDHIKNGYAERAFNLTTGIILKDDGHPFLPLAVLAAEEDRSRDASEKGRDYLCQTEQNNILGEACINLLYGKKDTPAIAYAPTSGSSGAQMRLWHMLREENSYATRKKLSKKMPVHISLPSWPDHVPLAQKYKYDVQTMPYLTENGDVDIDGIATAMRESSKHIFLFALDPHNPTGVSIKPAMPMIAELAKKKKHTVVLDISFPGFGESMEADIEPSTFLVQENITHIITVSLAKIFGMSGRRAGILGMVYGKNEGDSIAEDTHELREMGRWVAGHPDSDAADLIGRVLNNQEYADIFLREQAQMRTELDKKAALLRTGLPELDTQFKGMGPFRTLGTFSPAQWAEAEKQGVFLAPVEDVHGNTMARINLARIGSNKRIPLLIEKLKKIIKK